MVTRVRIEAMGATAAEVEKHLHAVADLVAAAAGDGVPHLGQQVISRVEAEPNGHTAHEGRLVVYLNTAHDAPQIAWLKEVTGECSNAPGLPLSPGQHMGATLGYEEVPEEASGRLRGAEDVVTAGP